jgi:hypothetical protein
MALRVEQVRRLFRSSGGRAQLSWLRVRLGGCPSQRWRWQATDVGNILEVAVGLPDGLIAGCPVHAVQGVQGVEQVSQASGCPSGSVRWS